MAIGTESARRAHAKISPTPSVRRLATFAAWFSVLRQYCPDLGRQLDVE